MNKYFETINNTEWKFHSLSQLFSEFTPILRSDTEKKNIVIENQKNAVSLRHKNDRYQTRVFEKHISRMVKKIPI